MKPITPGRYRLSRRHFKRYREIATVFIKHGLGWLLEALGLKRPAVTRQGHTPDPQKHRAIHVRLALEELGPTFIKLGQLLSTRPDLIPPEYVIELQKLQDEVPPVPWPELRAVLAQELHGPIEQAFAHIDPTPLASASLGQVHEACLRDGTAVVVKIQRPHIEDLIETDIDVLYNVAQLIGERGPLGGLSDPTEIVTEFAEALRGELDYRREAHYLERFTQNVNTLDYVALPLVYRQLSGKRVLVMSKLEGIKVREVSALKEAGIDCRRIAERLSTVMVASILESGFFHADPHPGNILALPGDKLGIIDFGRMDSLSETDRRRMAALVKAVLEVDEAKVADILSNFSRGPLEPDSLAPDVRRLLKRYRGLPLGAIKLGEVMQALLLVAYRHRLRLPTEWVLLMQSLSMVEAIVRELDPDFDVIKALEPHVQRLRRRRLHPEHWLPPALDAAEDWFALGQQFPQSASRLLRQAERGQLRFEMHVPEVLASLPKVDQAANRLSISLLIAALIIGLGLIIPSLDLATRPWDVITWLGVLGFGAVSLLGIALALAIWKSD